MNLSTINNLSLSLNNLIIFLNKKVLYLSISFFCYFIIPLHLFDNSPLTGDFAGFDYSVLMTMTMTPDV